MALYEVTLRQRYFDQLCINVFSYYVVGGGFVTPSALELLDLMGFIDVTGDPPVFPAGTIAGELSGLQNSAVQFLSVEARELYSTTDFYEAAYSPVVLGSITGDGLTPFVSYGLYSARVRLDIKRGFKRFVGVTESYVGQGGVVEGTLVDELVDLAEKMSEVLAGTTAAYNPCVISREKVVDPDTGRVTYQLYPTEAEQEEHIAYPLVWTPYTYVRSQTSRQYGRGQ